MDLRFKVTPDDWLDIEQVLLMFHPENSQVADAGEDAAIQDSILKYGFTAEMLVVNSWNQRLIGGHQRTRNCYALGYRGKLPVVYLRLESEAEHRLAMLQYNAARGHQDPDLLAKELAHLTSAGAAMDDVATAIAMTPVEITDLLRLAEQIPPESDAATEATPPDEQEFWPSIRLTVPPDTMTHYKRLLGMSAGADDNERFSALLHAVNLAKGTWDDEDE